jgi:hypothetical protein
MPPINRESIPAGFVPASEAAFALKMGRERLIRRIQSGEIKGKHHNGLWLVAESELARRAPAPLRRAQ